MAGSTVLELKQELMRQYRARLHRQIGALEDRLEQLQGLYGSARAIQRIRLKNKISRLHAELNQSAFVEVERPRSSGG